jgi:putative ATP-dependent endonuclease of the OLD family
LTALSFLLTGSPAVTVEDRTCVRSGEVPEGGVTNDGRRYARCAVTGTFRLTDDEQATLGLSDQIILRRVSTQDEPVLVQLLRAVPTDASLRGLDSAGRDELRARAGAYGLSAEGPATAKESWRIPLQRLADQQLREGRCTQEWVPAPKQVIERLPAFLHFSSTQEPEPEREIGTALRAVFRQLLEVEDRLAPVRELENQLQRALAEQARTLCDLIAARCPELGRVAVSPTVSFSEGLYGVEVYRISGDGRQVGLRQSGAGRRRQVNLAVWEWTRRLTDSAPSSAPGVVIAYDEPDTHLDYGHQRQLMDLILDQCAGAGVQMVVVTHSLNLIDRVDVADVVHLRLDEHERTVVERLLSPNHSEVDRYLAGVSSAMGLRNSVLLHERCFLGVEGDTEMQCLPVLFQLATGKPLQSAGIALINGRNNEGALRVAEYLHQSGRRVALLVDADSSTKPSSRKVFHPDKLKAAGFTTAQMLFIGTEEIEDAFSDGQWADTANALWPRNDGRSWLPDDFVALRGEAKFSKALDHMVRCVSDSAPMSKQQLLLGLATRLRTPAEVPSEIHQKFQQLIAFADGRHHLDGEAGSAVAAGLR